MTAASTSKPAQRAGRTKRVSFSTPDDGDISKNYTNPGGDGLLLHVRGHGKLCIQSASFDGNQSEVDINILVNIQSNKVPLTIFLPHEQANSQLEITGDGDIQFAVKESSEVRKRSKREFEVSRTPTSELNDLNKEVLVVSTGQNNEFKKTHRRNNSDFLQISGKEEHSDNEASEGHSIDNNTSDKLLKGSFDLLNKDQRKSKLEINNLEANTEVKDPCFMCEADSDKIEKEEENVSEKTKREDNLKTSHDSSKAKNSQLGSSKKSETEGLSRSFSFSQSLPEAGKSSFSLCDAIRESYTYLLDMLDLMDLCDHLYEKYVLDFDFYQKLFHMCFEPKHTRNAKRSLLMHLSTRTVQKEKLIDALYNSAQYQLIPCFFPDIRM